MFVKEDRQGKKNKSGNKYGWRSTSGPNGTKLEVNARCKSKGSIAAEIVDVNDDVVPGFSRGECDLFTGDSVCHTFSWRGKTDIPVFSTERAVYPEPERERLRKIRFYLENVELYSFVLGKNT